MAFDTSSVRSLVATLHAGSWDVTVLNHRGCGGEVNRLITAYHAGFIDDLRLVLDRLNKKKEYKELALAGLSMGGNLVLKYLGNRGAHVPRKLKVAAVVSAPLDLKSSVDKMMAGPLRLYQGRLARRIRKRLREKVRLHHVDIPEKLIRKMRSIRDVDRLYTGPVHGFKSGEDYWRRCSSAQYLRYIKVPTLILNAADDPFLTEASFPKEELKGHRHVCLEVPPHGGHLGFRPLKKGQPCWHELRLARYFEEILAAGAK